MYSEEILVPVVTPFKPNYEVCESSVAKLIERIRPYARGFLPCLSSGEGWCLSEQQWQDMVSISVKHANGLAVVVGVEKPTTEQVLEYALFAQSAGANGIMLTTPFGESVSQGQMVEHFEHIHNNTSIPIWIYHETSLSNNDMSLQSMLTVADFPRVIGIKDSGPDLSVNNHLDSFIAKGVAVFNGWEERMVATTQPCGNVVALSNLMPHICRQAASSGDAEPRQSEINALCKQYSLFEENWYKYVKESLFAQGIISTALVIADKP